MSWAKVAATPAKASQSEIPEVKKVAKPSSSAPVKKSFEDILAEVDFVTLDQITFDSKFHPDVKGTIRGWDLKDFKVGRVSCTKDQMVLSNKSGYVRLTSTATRSDSSPSIDFERGLDLYGDIITYIIERPLIDVDRLQLLKHNTSSRNGLVKDMKKYIICFSDDTFVTIFASNKFGEKDQANLTIEVSNPITQDQSQSDSD